MKTSPQMSSFAYVVPFFLVIAAGCGGSGGARTCTKQVSGERTCQETITNASNFSVSAYDEECVTEGGEVADSCPSGAVGKCGVTQSGNGFTTTLATYYYSGTVQARMQACTQALGTWTSL